MNINELLENVYKNFNFTQNKNEIINLHQKRIENFKNALCYILNSIEHLVIIKGQQDKNTFEYLGNLICYYQEIIEQELNPYNLFKKEISEQLFMSNDYIFCLKGHKTRGFSDATSFVFDLDGRNAMQVVCHATSDKNTNKQTPLFYTAVEDYETKNIYIMNKIFKLDKEYSIFAKELNGKANIISFLSMYNKIDSINYKLNQNENIIYFLRTPLIIFGQNINIYNQDIYKIFCEHYNIAYDESNILFWFYSFNYISNKGKDIDLINKLENWLKDYIFDFIDVIEISKINTFEKTTELIFSISKNTVVNFSIYFFIISLVKLINRSIKYINYNSYHKQTVK